MEKIDIANVIAENEGLIYSIINKYKNYFELDDLYQVAVIGLIKASKNYKRNFNTKFTTYAYQYIHGEVLQYINNNLCPIKINPKTKKLYYKILKTKEILSQKLMKNVSNYELSIFLGIDEQVINETILICSKVDSLDKIINDSTKELKLYDTLGKLDPNIENYHLKNALEKLSDGERKIIDLRYYEDMSQREVGKELGMYQVEVSRQEKQILKRIYKNIA